MPARINPTITITVHTERRQTFQGLGVSQVMNQPNGYGDLTDDERMVLAKLVWDDARFRILRTWWDPSTFAPSPGKEDISAYIKEYIACGTIPVAREAGATTVLLAPNGIPAYMDDGSGFIRGDQLPVYAGLIARFIFKVKEQAGVRIEATGILNEPYDRPIQFRTEQWPEVVKALRADLDSLGLDYIKIVAPETAEPVDLSTQMIEAIKADPVAWRSLAGISTHSYNMAANSQTADLIADSVKEYWITEAGGTSGNGAEEPGNAVNAAAAASRFLCDLNHRVTHWIWFIGYEIPDAEDDRQRLIRFTARPWRYEILQKYYYLKQLSRAFDVGAVLRHSTSSLEGDMAWTVGHKPKITVAAGENPDGTWAIGISNFTSDYFLSSQAPEWDRTHGGGPAQTYDVIVRIPELESRGGTSMNAYRSNRDVNAEPAGQASMHKGEVRLNNVAPLDLWTLRCVG